MSDEVDLESLLMADERAVSAFVASELSPLDSGRNGAVRRETFSAYSACGFNASAAATMLKVNDRTVAHRLDTIEELLGRSVRPQQAELQAAIHRERVLGLQPQR